jgi:hypothetical protein
MGCLDLLPREAKAINTARRREIIEVKRHVGHWYAPFQRLEHKKLGEEAVYLTQWSALGCESSDHQGQLVVASGGGSFAHGALMFVLQIVMCSPPLEIGAPDLLFSSDWNIS